MVNEQAVSSLVDRISTLVRDTMASSSPRRIVAERNGKHHFIDQADIDSLEADRNYVNIRVGEEVFTLRWTMLQAEATLEPGRFMRIHRSIIVNLEKIKELQPCNNGEYIVVLRTGKELSLSRSFRDRIQDYLRRSPTFLRGTSMQSTA